MSDGTTSVRLINYPPSTQDGSLRTLLLGGGVEGSFALLLEVEDDGTPDGELDVTLTISNAAEHYEIAEFLGDMIEMLETVRDSAQAQIDLKLLALMDDPEERQNGA